MSEAASLKHGIGWFEIIRPCYLPQNSQVPFIPPQVPACQHPGAAALSCVRLASGLPELATGALQALNCLVNVVGSAKDRRAGGLVSMRSIFCVVAVLALGAAALADDAKDCVQEKDRALSIQACTELVRSDPTNAVAYNHRGNALRGSGQLALAIADHTKAIEIDPQYVVAYANRCMDYLQMNELDRAMADCDAAIARNAKYSIAYFNRGLIHARKGQLELAIADHTEALARNPNYARAYNARAWAYFKQGNLLQSLPDVQRALELHPDDPATLDTRGHIYEALGRRAEAIADFRLALSKDGSLSGSREGLKRLHAAP